MSGNDRSSRLSSREHITLHRQQRDQRHKGIARRAFVVGLVLVWHGLIASAAQGADRIILRNLEVLGDRTVVSFDQDGVVLDDRRVLAWDEVERATVGQDQEKFDKLLADLGEPLFRLRQRLSVGDYQGLLPHAEALLPHYLARRSRTAHLVFQALMWGRLDAGQRESALEAYLLAIDCLQRLPPSMHGDLLPGDRRLRWDASTGLSPELPPVWFDEPAAREALSRVGRAIGAMKRPWPAGVRIYYASLALAAGDDARAAGALEQLDRTLPVIDQLAVLLQVEREVRRGSPGAATQQLDEQWTSYSGLSRVMALYWLGRAGVQDESPQRRQDGLLLLLRLPAAHGQEFPELAAAALYEADRHLRAAGDSAASTAVRGELLTSYSGTYYASQVRGAPAAPSSR